LGVMLYLWRRSALLFNDVKFRSIFGFITDGFEQNYAFWEVVVYGRKLLIISISAWPDLSRPAELALYQVVGVAAMLLHYAFKPFDNRSGELLDRVELYGLCSFLLLVTFMQVVLLANPSSEYDLLPVLMVCGILGMASVIMETHTSVLRFYMSLCLAGFFTILGVMYWVAGGIDNRQRTALMILGFALVLSACYIAWLCVRVIRGCGEAMAEGLTRLRLATDQKFLKAASTDAVQLALHARHMLSESVPYGSLFTKPAMPPKPSQALGAKLQRAVMEAHFETLGAKIWFDTKTRELVLGLHPDNFAGDARITNYMRRKLVASGPFLTDEERRFIAMGFRNALMHLIVDCDTNTVHCALLELLLRSTFVWQRRVEKKTSDQQEMAAESDSIEHFVDEMFDEATFETTMTAANFSEHLEKFTRMPKDKIAELSEAFLYAHGKHVYL